MKGVPVRIAALITKVCDWCSQVVKELWRKAALHVMPIIVDWMIPFAVCCHWRWSDPFCCIHCSWCHYWFFAAMYEVLTYNAFELAAPKIALSPWGSGPHLIYGTLGQHESAPKWLQPFLYKCLWVWVASLCLRTFISLFPGVFLCRFYWAGRCYDRCTIVCSLWNSGLAIQLHCRVVDKCLCIPVVSIYWCVVCVWVWPIVWS